jgi:hypothetical protein
MITIKNSIFILSAVFSQLDLEIFSDKRNRNINFIRIRHLLEVGNFQQIQWAINRIAMIVTSMSHMFTN